MATDERFDELITNWLEGSAPSGLPLHTLDATFDRTRASRQHGRWRGLLGGVQAPRSVIAVSGAAIAVAAVIVLSPRVEQPAVGELPTTPDDWSKVSIDSPWASGGVDGLVAGPRGLLAFLGEGGSHDMQLAASTDGRTWRLVPNDQFPSSAVLLPPQIGGRMPAVGTADGFLFVAEGNDVWASADGYTWGRQADGTQDPDLRGGAIHAIVAGGPGIVAVGSDNRAWYSEDGSDWTRAEVPAPSIDAFLAAGLPEPSVDMQGVAVAGDTLIAWGNATAGDGAGGTMVEPVLWTSDDGRSWATVSDVTGIGWLQDVAAGPDGFVAIGGADLTDAGGIWFSEDVRVWQPAEAEGFRDAQASSPEVTKSSIAGTSFGYVAVAGEQGCAEGPCPDARAAVWSSPDGRSWSRLPSDDRFEIAERATPGHAGVWATSVDAWGLHFVVAGTYDASPAIWISGTSSATETPDVTATPSETPSSSTTETTIPSTSAALPDAPIAQLEAWLAARIAGEGAEGAVDTEDDRGDGRCNKSFVAMCRIEEVPLLYATTSGARYERYEIEREDAPSSSDIEMEFTVRLFADGGATVVEQPVMWIDGRLLSLVTAMTENGRPVAVPYVFLDGGLTASAARPWVPTHQAFNYGLSTDGQYGGERISFMPDPYLSTVECPFGEEPADAATLAQSIRSCPQFEATAPVEATVGGAEGLSMDVTLAPGASVWPDADGNSTVVLSTVPYPYDYPIDGTSWRASIGPDTRVRLYLVDLPEGSSARIMAIAIGAPQARFESVVEAAAPVLDSIEFGAP